MTLKFNAEPDADSFRIGDVWESPRGTLYKCTEVRFQGAGDGLSLPRRGVKKAVLRAGADGAGKRIVRDWDAVVAGGQFWIRHSWGGQL